MNRPARAAALLLGLLLLPTLCATLWAALLLASALPARAETTAWVENEGGRMRIVALPPRPDGVAEATLQIEPKPGWVTYWREPGDSGIPPQIGVTGGAKLGVLSYPVPKVLALGPLRDIGYDAPVSLPFTLTEVSGPAEAQVFIGICNRICIPFQAQLALQLRAGSADAGERASVAKARASVPAGADDRLKTESATFRDDVLVLSVRTPGAGAEVEAIVTGPPGTVFTASGTADGERSATLHVPLTGLSREKAAATATWSVLLQAGGRAVETAVSPR